MFKKISFIMVVYFCLFRASYSMSGTPDMDEGLWEITMKMEMPGMPILRMCYFYPCQTSYL
jgi:hypothetical protein